LQSDNIQIAASGMSIKPERQEQVDFSDPYIDAGLAIAVAGNNETIKGVDDLKGKTVAVQIGTTGASKAEEHKAQGIIKSIKTIPTVDVVMMELINGGVDAVINDLPVTEAYIAKQPGKIKIVGDVLESDSYGFAVRKGNTELLEKINAGLKNVIANGKYTEIQKKYFEDNMVE
jgi:glutamine transport system substrate-binding protein